MEVPNLKDLGVSPHKVLTDLLKWESWGFTQTPKWAYIYRDLGWDAIKTRWFLWKQLAQHYAREAGVPTDEDGCFLPPPGSDDIFEEPPVMPAEFAPPADPVGRE